MRETAAELEALQALIDHSAATAGAHLASILTPDRRLGARALADRMSGMRLVVVATVTADGRPLAGPVDGYLLHGSFHFSSARDSVRIRHLAVRPAVSLTYHEGEELAVTVHGRAELFDVLDPARDELARAMVDHYGPTQGAAFTDWLRTERPVGARVVADKLFTFALEP